MLEVLVQVRVVAREDDRSGAAVGEARVYRRELRREGVLTAREDRNARQNFGGVAWNQLNASGRLQRREHLCIVGIDRTIQHRARVVRVMLEFLALKPD